MNTADLAWFTAYQRVMLDGEPAHPRGLETLELLHQTHCIDMRYPLVTMPKRNLSYRFAAAEALWILEGSDQLDELLPYNARMAEFSDDGRTLAGAYGPRIGSQMSYVLKTLRKDPDTRQATLTIWTPNPEPSKDIPCTVAMDFKIRRGELHMSVFMRSSDVWLGLPYDIFSFCCVGYMVISLLRRGEHYPDLKPGLLHITAASSHLYTRDITAELPYIQRPRPAPKEMWEDFDFLYDHLSALRKTKKGDPLRWWEK